MWRLSSIAVFALMAGCVRPEYGYPRTYYNGSGGAASEALFSEPDVRESLFPSDVAVVSNEVVEALLNSRVILPASSRLGIVRYQYREPLPWWSEQLYQMDSELLPGFAEKLTASDRIAESIIIPRLLLPSRFTIPHLREVAARCRCDLLFVYRVDHDYYQRTKLVAADEIRAYCLIEAALLDTRTGTVPFTSAVTRDYTTRRTRDDFSTDETARRARLEALGDALDQTAADLLSFLKSID